MSWSRLTRPMAPFTTQSEVVEVSSAQAQQALNGLQWVLVACLALGLSGTVSVFSTGGAPPGWPAADTSPAWPACLVAVALAVAAVREATRSPRLDSQATAWELLRTLLQLVGDLLLMPLFMCLPGEVPVLGYQCTPRNLEILSRCPSLQHFKQVAWLRSPYLAFAALMWSDFKGAERARKAVRRELLQAPDGGIVALDWWEDGPSAAEAKGVLFVGSTFTGDALITVTRELCRLGSARGWRCVVMVKRGCGLAMPNRQDTTKAAGAAVPKPWCLAGLSDTELALEHAARACPGLPIVGVGFSTGGGQLRNYINTAGKGSKLAAAVIIDAAPEWVSALESLDRRCPLVAKALSRAGEITYQDVAMPAAAGAPETDTEVLPGGMFEFMRDRMAPAHGYERSAAGARQYMRACQPAGSSKCAVPVLELVTLKDTLMTPDTVRRLHRTYEASPHLVTVMTREGTHMVRWEGWRATCWLCRASVEFLESALQQVAA